MLLTRKSISTIVALCILTLILSLVSSGVTVAGDVGQLQNFQDTTINPTNYKDSLRFPITDRRGDFVSSGSKHTYDL